MRANISRARARRISRSAVSSSSTKSVNEVCFSAACCASAVYCAVTPQSRMADHWSRLSLRSAMPVFFKDLQICLKFAHASPFRAPRWRSNYLNK